MSFSSGELPISRFRGKPVSQNLFTPLRQRLQAIIDRRFYRQKYNAEQAVAAFATAARSEVELDALGSNLVIAAREALQPESVSLWLNPKEGNR